MYLENLVIDALEPITEHPRLHLHLAGPTQAGEVDRLLALGARGPVAVIVLDSADPELDADFWASTTGRQRVADADHRLLRHPSGRGPALELRPERSSKGPAKNRRDRAAGVLG